MILGKPAHAGFTAGTLTEFNFRFAKERSETLKTVHRIVGEAPPKPDGKQCPWAAPGDSYHAPPPPVACLHLAEQCYLLSFVCPFSENSSVCPPLCQGTVTSDVPFTPRTGHIRWPLEHRVQRHPLPLSKRRKHVF